MSLLRLSTWSLLRWLRITPRVGDLMDTMEKGGSEEKCWYLLCHLSHGHVLYKFLRRGHGALPIWVNKSCGLPLPCPLSCLLPIYSAFMGTGSSKHWTYISNDHQQVFYLFIELEPDGRPQLAGECSKGGVAMELDIRIRIRIRLRFEFLDLEDSLLGGI